MQNRRLSARTEKAQLLVNIHALSYDELLQEQAASKVALTKLVSTLEELKAEKIKAEAAYKRSKTSLKKAKKKKHNEENINQLFDEKYENINTITKIDERIRECQDESLHETILSLRISRRIEELNQLRIVQLRLLRNEPAQIQVVPDLREYVDLIAYIKICEAENKYDIYFIQAARALAETYRYATATKAEADNSRIVLIAAQNVLVENTPEVTKHRDFFIQLIKENTEGKREKGVIVGGILLGFLAAAFIAAGIAACASLALIELGAPLLVFGAFLTALSITMISIGCEPQGKARALNNFNKQANTASRLGIFNHENNEKVDPLQAAFGSQEAAVEIVLR